METLLVFRTGDYATWQEKLGGVADCAREHDWNVQVVDARRGRIAVANFCGWKSALAFRKSFKVRFGHSPGASRRRNLV